MERSSPARGAPQTAFRNWPAPWLAWTLLAPMILSIIGMAGVLLASEVSLTWNQNTESDLAGYKLYQATTPGQYGAPVATLGKVTQHTRTLPDLSTSQTYYFALTAYDLTGNESGKSSEVSKLVSGTPLPPALPMPTKFTATPLLDGRTQLAWDNMQLAPGAGYLLRVHLAGTPYDPCTSMAYCGPVIPANTLTLALPPGTYDAWVHSARSVSDWGPSAGLKFTVVAAAPVDPPPAQPTGLKILSGTASEIVIVASAKDCPRVVTSTKGSTASTPRRTITCTQ